MALKLLATIAMSPGHYGQPAQLVVIHDEEAADGPVIRLRKQVIAQAGGDWLVSTGLDVKPEDLGTLVDALDKVHMQLQFERAEKFCEDVRAGRVERGVNALAGLVAGDTDEPSADGEPSAFWDNQQRAGRMERLLGDSKPVDGVSAVNLTAEHFAAFTRSEDEPDPTTETVTVAVGGELGK